MKAQHIQTYGTLWKKALLKEKFIALSAHIKKMERAHTSDLTVRLKAEEKKKKQAYLGGVEDRK